MEGIQRTSLALAEAMVAAGQAKPVSHSLSLTHPLTLSYAHSLTHSITLSRTLSLTLSHTLLLFSFLSHDDMQEM